MLVAVVALVFSCTGGAVAATLITGKQIKNGTITAADIKGGTIGPSKLSLGLQDAIDEGVGAAGPQGAQGPAGPAGPAGPQGPAGPSDLSGLNVVTSQQVQFGSNVAQVATAFCPPGQKVVSGGGVSVSDEQLAATEPTSDRSGWFVIGLDATEDGGEYVQAQALCAGSGKAVAASTPAAAHKRVMEQLAARLAQIRAQIHAKRS
jgi:hypothetical protein